MVARLRDEIKQTKPFGLPEEELYLALQRTADSLLQGVEAALKPHGLSATQYNVLRILRGAEPDGLPCREIGARLITREPDVTRLLDRMERRELVTRARLSSDRRVVRVRISASGLRLLKNLDTSIAETHRRQLGHLRGAHLRDLLTLLEAAREQAR